MSLVLPHLLLIHFSLLILFQLCTEKSDSALTLLEPDRLIATHLPEWRATVGVKRNGAQASYQGEVNPFPNKASLLTFHPFIQVQETENYLVLLNVESSPLFRWSELEIYSSETEKIIDIVHVKNNCISIIPLDQYGFSEKELPIFQCKKMAGIPFGFGKSKTSSILSLEHTHPPGSLTLFGNRFNDKCLVIIDIEGAEYNCLRGASFLLNNKQCIYFIEIEVTYSVLFTINKCQ